MERPSFVCTMPQPAELNEFTAIFFTRPSLKCLPGWLNFITLWGLLGYCLPRKIVLMALSALLIAKCFVCISYSWHCSWWVLQATWKKTCRTWAPPRHLRKGTALFWSEASRYLFGAIVSHLWKQSWYSAAMQPHTGVAVKISQCI